MAKGNILSDSFEQLVELGQSTAKGGAKSIAQTFSPLKLLDHLTGKSNVDASAVNEHSEKTVETKGEKSTPLKFDKLQEQYKNQDKLKIESLRNRLFQLVKREDEKSLERKKTKEAEKKRKEEYEKQEKKKKLAQQHQTQQIIEEPHGKIRRSIFSPKKVVQRTQAEVRPATGKQ